MGLMMIEELRSNCNDNQQEPRSSRDEDHEFLRILDPDAEFFTFQTFNDDKGNGKDAANLAHILHGTLDEHADQLRGLNLAGAGVFVMVNAGDGEGRRAANVKQVRAVFVDLDGAPIEPVLGCKLKPHMVVETSPGRYHAYWRVDGLPLEQFRSVQKAIAVRFGGDPQVHDLARVMRVPGFQHRKSEPFFRTRIVETNDDPPYTAAAIITEFGTESDAQQGAGSKAREIAGVKIKEGDRNSTLSSVAGSMRHQG